MIKLKKILFERMLGQQQDDIQDNIHTIANKFHETPKHRISSGYYGMTYLMQSGKVLKFTTDSNEAALAARLSKRPSSPHLIGIYDVRSLILPRTFDQHGIVNSQRLIWVIHMDEIIPLNDISKSAANGYESLKYDFYGGGATDEYIKGRIDDLVTRDKITESDKQILLKILSQRKSILQDVRRFNIKWEEAHYRNIGFKKPGDQFVIYDLQSNKYHGLPKEYNMGAPIDLNEPITRYTTDGIDTPGDPDM